MAKILIVDDSRLSTSALSNMLGEMGHTVADTAFSGEDGITKAKTVNPDIVCLDYVMPGIDGKDTAKKLASQNPNAKIVMITQNPVDDADKAEINAIAYVVKPITRAKLDEAFSGI